MLRLDFWLSAKDCGTAQNTIGHPGKNISLFMIANAYAGKNTGMTTSGGYLEYFNLSTSDHSLKYSLSSCNTTSMYSVSISMGPS